MPRLPRTPLLVLGVLLMLAAGLGGAYLGPDDTVMIGEMSESGSQSGLPVVTDPVITSFDNIDLVVRVESAGRTFLGASHRVDADDLLAGVRHFEVTRLSPDRVGGRVVDGARVRLRPQKIVGWRESSVGEGVQELVLPLTGEPLAVVAVPLGKGDTVSIAFGVHVEHFFLGVVVLGVTGAVMVLLWWWLGRRRRDRPQVGARGKDKEFVAVRTPPKDSLRLGFVPVLASAVLLSGCGRAPAQVAVPDTDRSGAKVALSAGEAQEAADDYGVRRARAARRARTLAPFTAWELAHTGPMLEASAIASEGLQRDGRRQPVPSREVVAGPVYSPSFGSYPMWSAVTLTQGERSRLVVLTRARFAGGWMGTVGVDLGRPTGGGAATDRLPQPVSRAIPPSRRILATAAAAIVRVGDYWRTGRAPGLSVDAATRRARKRLAADSGTLPITVAPWFDPPQRLRVVEVRGGHLALGVQSVRTTERFMLTSAVFVSDGGRVELLGSTLAPSLN